MIGPFFENRLLCLALYKKWHIPWRKGCFGQVHRCLHCAASSRLPRTSDHQVPVHHGASDEIHVVPRCLLAKDTVSKQLVSVMLRSGKPRQSRYETCHSDPTNVQDVFHGSIFIAQAKQDGSCSSHIPIDGGLLPTSSRAYILLLAASCIVLRNRWSQVRHNVYSGHTAPPGAPQDTEQAAGIVTMKHAGPYCRAVSRCPRLPCSSPALSRVFDEAPGVCLTHWARTCCAGSSNELCVDNLMPEFLDPTLSPVLRDSMGALHDILRPLRHPHISAHTMICILGKLGGRNRHLQHEPLQPAYRSGGDDLKLLLSSDGRNGAIDISPVCRLAAKSIHHAHPAYWAYKALKAAITIIVHKVIHQLRPLSI